MKIKIKTEKHNISLAFPTGLLTGRFAVNLAEKYGRKYAGEVMDRLPPHGLEVLCDEIRRLKKLRGDLELVDAVSAEGDEIHISL